MILHPPPPSQPTVYRCSELMIAPRGGGGVHFCPCDRSQVDPHEVFLRFPCRSRTCGRCTRRGAGTSSPPETVSGSNTRTSWVRGGLATRPAPAPPLPRPHRRHTRSFLHLQTHDCGTLIGLFSFGPRRLLSCKLSLLIALFTRLTPTCCAVGRADVGETRRPTCGCAQSLRCCEGVSATSTQTRPR